MATWTGWAGSDAEGQVTAAPCSLGPPRGGATSDHSAALPTCCPCLGRSPEGRPPCQPHPLPPSSVPCKLCSEPSAVWRPPTQSVPPRRSHPRLGAHIEVGDAPVNLSPVAIGSGGRRCRGQAAVGDGARVPVGPVDVASLDVDIHGIDADALVTLEGLLVSRMRVAGE